MPESTRRAFVQTAAATATALITQPTMLFGAAHKKIPIGVQMSSLRATKLTMAELPSLLAGFKKQGFEGAAFSFYITGYYGTDAKTLRRVLDDTGLKCCCINLDMDALLGDELKKTIELSKILGNSDLVAVTSPKEYTAGVDGWTKAAKVFSRIAQELKPHKMRTGYHSHSEHFQPVDGKVPWHVFGDNSSKDVIMQLDFGHCALGGADPVAELKRYPGRGISVHVRDYDASKGGAMAIGEGKLNLAEAIKVCETTAGTEWYVIETNSMELIERGMRNLKKLLA